MYQVPSLIQLAPVVVISTGVTSPKESGSHVRHDTLKTLKYVVFWLSLLVSSTAMIYEVFATLKSPVAWILTPLLGLDTTYTAGMRSNSKVQRFMYIPIA